MKLFNLALLAAVVAGVKFAPGEAPPAPPQISYDPDTGNKIVTHADGTVVTIDRDAGEITVVRPDGTTSTRDIPPRISDDSDDE